MTFTRNLYHYEQELYNVGFEVIAGVDEVGRGPLAGPLVVCALIMPKGFYIDGVDDSKKLSEKKRESLARQIREQAMAISIVYKEPAFIDKHNIYRATQIAMKEAILTLKVKPDYVLVDAMPLDIDINSLSIIKGDANSATIAAASIIAKVERDSYMCKMALKYPNYGFEKHKGYPTKLHIEAIEKYGITDIHRKSYGPVKDRLTKQLSFDFN